MAHQPRQQITSSEPNSGLGQGRRRKKITPACTSAPGLSTGGGRVQGFQKAELLRPSLTWPARPAGGHFSTSVRPRASFNATLGWPAVASTCMPSPLSSLLEHRKPTAWCRKRRRAPAWSSCRAPPASSPPSCNARAGEAPPDAAVRPPILLKPLCAAALQPGAEPGEGPGGLLLPGVLQGLLGGAQEAAQGAVGQGGGRLRLAPGAVPGAAARLLLLPGG